jgi:hypothetical protein
LQSLYCSEKCLETDWSRAHNGICTKIRPFTHEFSDYSFLEDDHAESPSPSLSVLIHVIGRIGLDNIRKTALENKPMPSLLGDPRTKGFQNGKFKEANLEALLSLEDSFDTLCADEKLFASQVSRIHKFY